MLKMKLSKLRSIRRYGFFASLKILLDLFQTKLFFKNALLIRTPYSIKGLGEVIFGKGFLSGNNLRIDCINERSKLVFGENVKVGNNLRIAILENIEIGDNVLIASNVFITDHSHGSYNNDNLVSAPNVPPIDRPLICKSVKIGKNCWIGEGVVILKGVQIGDGCVIGALSVVQNDIQENSIAAGAPAKVFKKYSNELQQWIKY
jgi:lipopolysaccharide O-acetyltransferase